jgi:hypothetical protein
MVLATLFQFRWAPSYVTCVFLSLTLSVRWRGVALPVFRSVAGKGLPGCHFRLRGEIFYSSKRTARFQIFLWKTIAESYILNGSVNILLSDYHRKFGVQHLITSTPVLGFTETLTQDYGK